MKIEFTDSRIKEYSQGVGFHLKNEGKPIDVSAANGAELLNAKHLLDGVQVNIFRLAESAPKRVSDARLIENTYPENFPHADILTKAGINHEAARMLNKEQLMEVNGIGEAKADAILDAIKE